jgi:hypothetical protein
VASLSGAKHPIVALVKEKRAEILAAAAFLSKSVNRPFWVRAELVSGSGDRKNKNWLCLHPSNVFCYLRHEIDDKIATFIHSMAQNDEFQVSLFPDPPT